jgi:hypothetical protein
VLPDIPAAAEFVPGYEASAWFGVGVPMKARLTDLGGIALRGSPSDFGKLIVEETEKWGKVVKFTGIKAD